MLNDNIKNLLYPIVVNIEYIEDTGVYYGLSGATIFLFALDENIERDIVYSLACEKTFHIIEHFNVGLKSYSTGCVGEARALFYLNKKEFVDIKYDHQIFDMVDREIYSLNTSVTLDTESCGITAYVMDRFLAAPFTEFFQLMRNERIIAHVDCIDNFLNSIELPWEIVRDIFELSAKRDSLENEVHNITNAAYILQGSNDCKVYPEVTRNCQSRLTIRLKNLLQQVKKISGSAYIIAELLPELQLYIYELINISLSSTEFEEHDIQDYLDIANQMSKEIANKRITRSVVHTFQMINILHIILPKLSEPVFSKAIIPGIQQVLETLTSEVNNLYLDYKYKGKLNIGLTGISGIGLHLISKDDEWKKLLLKI